MWFKFLFFRKLPTNVKEMEELAGKLGVTMAGLGETMAGRTYVNEAELQKRLTDALRFRRESLTWLFALISALASLGSAIAAWTAVTISN